MVARAVQPSVVGSHGHLRRDVHAPIVPAVKVVKVGARGEHARVLTCTITSRLGASPSALKASDSISLTNPRAARRRLSKSDSEESAIGREAVPPQEWRHDRVRPRALAMPTALRSATNHSPSPPGG